MPMSGPRGLRRFVPAAGSPATSPSPASATDQAAAPHHELTPPPVPAAREAAQADEAALALDALRAAPAAFADAIARGEPAPAGAADAERCEICATEVPAEHGHIADLEAATLACACRACYLLFTQPSAGRGRYRAVPDRYVRDPAAPLTAADWAALEIPVGLAFFLASGADGRVTGFYPSPAGATECILDLDSWQRLAADHPLLRAAEPDVEAVLICQSAGDGVESFVVPIDACYELAGRMRLHWRGFDGGAEARASIEEFLTRVRSRARPLPEPSATGLSATGSSATGPSATGPSAGGSAA
jgi:hypothetical protein